MDEQFANGGQGFVDNFARISEARAEKLKVPVPDPGLVMGYYDADDLPVYDHLAAEYCVVDRWFSSVPGATWPNRLYAMCGQAAGSRDDESIPIYALPTFIRYLDEYGVDWRWYSFDPATLRAADPEYRLSHHDRFGYVDAAQAVDPRGGRGKLTEKGSFLDDVANGNLAAGVVDRSAFQGPARARPRLQRRPPTVRRDRRSGPDPDRLPRAAERPELGRARC